MYTHSYGAVDVFVPRPLSLGIVLVGLVFLCIPEAAAQPFSLQVEALHHGL